MVLKTGDGTVKLATDARNGPQYFVVGAGKGAQILGSIRSAPPQIESTLGLLDYLPRNQASARVLAQTLRL